MKELREGLFGAITPIPHDEYHNIYAATGLDIDGRRKKLQSIISSFESSFQRNVDFIKVIPGIERLPTQDQIALLKGNGNY